MRWQALEEELAQHSTVDGLRTSAEELYYAPQELARPSVTELLCVWRAAAEFLSSLKRQLFVAGLPSRYRMTVPADCCGTRTVYQTRHRFYSG